MHKKGIDKNIFCTYVALALGILVGCLYFLFSVTYGETILLEHGLEDYNITAMLNAPKHEMLAHLLKKRLLQTIIFVLSIILTTYSCSSFIFCGGFGIYYGLVVSNLIVKYGFSGLLYGFVCFFPHYFFVFMAIFLYGQWSDRKKAYYIKCHKDVNKIEKCVKIFVIFLLLILSFVWEIQFQKNFLNYFFQHLV